VLINSIDGAVNTTTVVRGVDCGVSGWKGSGGDIFNLLALGKLEMTLVVIIAS
jgi:hypothetical protein